MLKRIPESELREKRERVEAATEGPFEGRGVELSSRMPAKVIRGTQTIAIIPQIPGRRDLQARDDAEFFAHARADLRCLLDGIDDAYAELDTQAERIKALEDDLENYKAAGAEDLERAESAQARLGRFITDEEPEYRSEGEIPICIECGDPVTDCDNPEYCAEIVAIRRGRLADRKRIAALEKLIRRIRPAEHDNDCPLRYEPMDLPDRCDCEFYSISAGIDALLPKEKSDAG